MMKSTAGAADTDEGRYNDFDILNKISQIFLNLNCFSERQTIANFFNSHITCNSLIIFIM